MLLLVIVLLPLRLGLLVLVERDGERHVVPYVAGADLRVVQKGVTVELQRDLGICICMCIYIYNIYIYIERERER